MIGAATWLGGRRSGLVALRVGLLWTLTMVAAPVLAGSPAPGAVAEAKVLFKAGAEAYAVADYEAALHAFGAARELVPDAALTFTIAQSHRRLFLAKQSPAQLRQAIAEYRRYLAEVPKGGRRGDAAEALLELEPKLFELGEAQDESLEPARKATRLMVLSSIEGALVSLDGAPAETAPFIGEVEPGTHVVTVTAPGYSSYVRTIKLKPGQVASIDPILEPLPATLLVKGKEGSTLWVDGIARGQLPLAVPLAVPPGRRLIGVTLDGHRRFELEVQLEKDRRKELEVALESSAQRTTSYVTLALAGASLATGVVFAAVAGSVYGENRSTYDRYQSESIDAQQLAAYDGNRDAHVPYAMTAIVTGAAGVALGLAGAMLYLFDEPAAPSLVGASRSRPLGPSVGVVPARDGVLLDARVTF